MPSWKAALKMTLENAGVITGLRAHEKAATGADTATKKATASLNVMSGKLRETAAAGNAVTSGVGKWTEFASKMQIAGLAVRGVSAAGRALGSVFKSDVNFETLVRSLGAVTKDSETLEKQMSELQKVAAAPGIDMAQAVQGSAALQSVGQSAAESRDTLREFANATAKAGGNAETLGGVMMALRQMMSKPTVQAEEIMQISERIPEFMSIATRLENLKSDPKKFVSAAVDEMSKLSRVAAGSAEAADNLADAWDRAKVASSGGRVAAAGSSLMNYAGDVLSNGFNKENFAKMMIGVDDAVQGNVKSPIQQFEPGKDEIKKRQEAAKQAIEERKAGAESLAQIVFDTEIAEMNMEGELQAAKAKGNADEIRALEEKQFLLKNVAKMAKEMGVSEQFVTDQIKAQLAVKRIIVNEANKAAGAKTLREAQGSSAVDQLRSRGKDKAADKLEEQQRKSARFKDLIAGNVPRADAINQVNSEARTREDQEYLDRTGRVKMRGAVSTRKDGQGLSGYDFSYKKQGYGAVNEFEPRLLDLDPRSSGSDGPRGGPFARSNNRRADRMAAMGTGADRAGRAAANGALGHDVALVIAKKQLEQQQETNRVLRSIEQKRAPKR